MGIVLLLAQGCTGREVARNLYEGARDYQESQEPPGLERCNPPRPSYQQYERERSGPVER